ncbi:MAG: hypothetical protein LBP51_06905 [Deferribacteraceae bacterium]|jgi:hypothetical protein|nr:hypothetical protein [Deferribacteraceae bacterium]
METILLILLIISGLLFIVQAILSFAGVGFELDFDLEGGATDSPFGMLTIRNLITFVLGFSSGAYIPLKFGAPVPIALISGVIFGGLLSAVIIVGLRFLIKLQQINKVESHEYRGLTAKVLVKIGPERSSAGKVEFVLHERIDEMLALSDEKTALHPGEEVYVSRLLENGMLLVAKAMI